MATLRERFSIPVEFRDRAEKLLNSKGHEVLDAEGGGAEFGRDGTPCSSHVSTVAMSPAPRAATSLPASARRIEVSPRPQSRSSVRRGGKGIRASIQLLLR